MERELLPRFEYGMQEFKEDKAMEKHKQIHRITFYFKEPDEKSIQEDKFIHCPRELFFEFGELGALYTCNVSKLKYFKEEGKILAGGSVNHQYSFEQGLKVLEKSPSRFEPKARAQQSLQYRENGENVVEQAQEESISLEEAINLLKQAEKVPTPEGHSFSDEKIT